MLLTKSLKYKKFNWIESTPGEEYTLTFHTGAFVHRDITDSITDALNVICEQTQHKRLGLFLSGGIDSSLIAHFLTINNIDFEPVIIRYDHNLNIEDVNNAIGVCDKLKLDPVILDITHHEFTEYFYQRAYSEYLVCSLSQAQLFWATEKLGPEYFMMSGEGDPRVFKYQTKDVLGMEMKPQWVAIVDRFNKLSGCYLHHQFWETTSDLWYNYHTHHEVTSLKENLDDIPNFKRRLWGTNYWQPKRTGFEKWSMNYQTMPSDDQLKHLEELIPKYHTEEPLTLHYDKFWSWMLSPDTQAHINDLR